jgi:hypothetical protein
MFSNGEFEIFKVAPLINADNLWHMGHLFKNPRDLIDGDTAEFDIAFLIQELRDKLDE